MHTTDVQPQTLPQALRDLYFHWTARCDGPRPPRLGDLQIQHLVAFGPNIALSEAVFDDIGDIADFTVLFIDAELRSDRLRRMMGKRFSELPGKGRGSRLFSAHAACITQARPLRARFPYIGEDPQIGSTCDVLLPVAADDGLLRYVLTGVIFLPDPDPGIA